MIYPYRCKTCGHDFEIICKVSEYQAEVPCKGEGCEATAKRYYTPHHVMGADDWNNTEYNPGLGCVTRNRKHAREIAKSRGLIEVGNEKTESIHKEFDKKRADKRKERWDSV